MFCFSAYINISGNPLRCILNTYSAIVRVLVSHGADLNLHGGSDGWTPLFYAAMAGILI